MCWDDDSAVFSYLSLAKVRGMQKSSCCFFLNSTSLTSPILCYSICNKNDRLALWDICMLDSVTITVCDIVHKLQSYMLCSAHHSVFLIEYLSVSKCSLCFDV